MVKIETTGKFVQQFNELRFEDPELEAEINKRIHWFQKNPRDTRLKDHRLSKRMAGKRAFSITSDVRLVYECLSETSVRFLAIGGHKRVYKRKIG